ncbi:hypothetical protein H7Y29_00920 [Microbacteriaceae bacterium]|nr:hypothetical protein [Candidatus Saccharibacteria bacterium]
MGYILKVDTGEYTLTNIGKEFANRLDEKTGYEYPNPKSSVLMLVWAQTDDGTFVLAHQRSRRPYYGFWGIASAPLHRGVAAAQSAEQEFLKQTGIKVNFHPYGCRRIIDKNTQGDVLEDKLFVIMRAQCDEMPTLHDWTGGKSEWISSEELLLKDKVFSTTAYALKTLNAPAEFSEEICIYTDYEY